MLVNGSLFLPPLHSMGATARGHCQTFLGAGMEREAARGCRTAPESRPLSTRRKNRVCVRSPQPPS